MEKYFTWVQKTTERQLTKRLQRIAREKAQKAQKKTLKGELLSWLDAIVFAVVFVLLINQYVFQLFLIPTPSMENTLLVKDRVFVSKTAYGVELYPGGSKLFDDRIPLRDDVIVFYNPEYDSRGPVFDVLSQMLYMATFSLVNIDVDEEGNMRERLYVKRAAALGGDTVRFQQGLAYISGAGQKAFIDDTSFRQENLLSTAPHQSLDPSLYPGIQAYGKLLAYQDMDLSAAAPRHLIQTYQQVADYRGIVDYYAVEQSRTATLSHLEPHNLSYRSSAARYNLGIYVPHGYVLPLGDNRDNSHDGRYFGPVSNDSIIGRVRFTFWPLSRMGSVS
jgi:signal peptidase I